MADEMTPQRRWVIERLIPAMRDRESAVKDLQRGFPIIESYLAEEFELPVLDMALEVYCNQVSQDRRELKEVLRRWVDLQEQIDIYATPEPAAYRQAIVNKYRADMQGLMASLVTRELLGRRIRPEMLEQPRWMLMVAFEVVMWARLDRGPAPFGPRAFHEAMDRFSVGISQRFELAS